MYSLRSVTLIAGVLGRAGQRGQQRRLADANDGIVTWDTPNDVAKFVDRDSVEKAQKEAQAAQATGGMEEQVLSREDFLTDDELLAELTDAPAVPQQP
jgi:hypothetical protein